jgi:hypothetical protein
MPEGFNVEVAHKLSEQEEHTPNRARSEFIEILEVIVLAVVAVATAWSGYQAARWDGAQAKLYGDSSHARFDADAASTYGGQVLVTDVSLFTAWLQAHQGGDADLERVLRKRMSPEYQTAFVAWLATDPFINPKAPVGPRAMPQYHNPYFDGRRR